MAEWFTGEHRWELIRRYGLKGPSTPEQMAIDEARARDSEVRELWATRDRWATQQEEFSRLLWPKVFRVLGIAPPSSRRPPRASKQGEWEGKAFSTDEVDKAAGIYMGNRDLTPWEVWALYERVRDADDKGKLGRRKVEDLVAMLDAGEITWNANAKRVEGLVRSLREPERVLIPRRETAS